jgi:hypothetical protein
MTMPPRMRISPSSAIAKPTPGSGRPTVPMRSAPSWLTDAAAVVSVRP